MGSQHQGAKGFGVYGLRWFPEIRVPSFGRPVDNKDTLFWCLVLGMRMRVYAESAMVLWEENRVLTLEIRGLG